MKKLLINVYMDCVVSERYVKKEPKKYNIKKETVDLVLYIRELKTCSYYY